MHNSPLSPVEYHSPPTTGTLPDPSKRPGRSTRMIVESMTPCDQALGTWVSVAQGLWGVDLASSRAISFETTKDTMGNQTIEGLFQNSATAELDVMWRLGHLATLNMAEVAVGPEGISRKGIATILNSSLHQLTFASYLSTARSVILLHSNQSFARISLA